MTNTVVIPSNPADQKAIKDAIKEASDSKVRIEGEQDQIKAIIDDLHEKFELPKDFIRKMINTYHNQSYDKDIAKVEDFQQLYETIFP